MAFRGWPVEALEFYEGLEADNSKAYWQRHKAVVRDQSSAAPMEELLAELEPEWGEGRIFRPYRDVRFSADKSPYKTSIAAIDRATATSSSRRDGLAAGAGMWEMAPDQLERYRAGGRRRRARAGARRRSSRGDPAAGVEVDRPRRAEDRAEGLPEGPSADRAAAVQGHRRVAGVAGRRVARHAEGEGPRRRAVPVAEPLNAWLAKHVGQALGKLRRGRCSWSTWFERC